VLKILRGVKIDFYHFNSTTKNGFFPDDNNWIIIKYGKKAVNAGKNELNM
jgi:hypothetical protein